MRKHELEYLIHAAGGIAQSNEIYIINKQSVLSSFPYCPEEFLQAIYTDIWQTAGDL